MRSKYWMIFSTLVRLEKNANMDLNASDPDEIESGYF